MFAVLDRPAHKARSHILLRHGDAVVLLIFGIASAAIDWQIATTWSLPEWISLLCGAVLIVALAIVFSQPRLQELGAAMAVALLYALPVIGGIVRAALVPSPIALIGDGSLQIHLARNVLMRGQDPYGFNYVGTGLERTPWGQPFVNPALHHLDYWPGTILLPLPIQASVQWLTHWWDERLWLLLAAVAIWILLRRLIPGVPGRMAAIAFFLIPGHSLLAVLGDNDLPLVALLLAAVLTIRHRNWLLAALLIGLAVATKQTALIAVPVLTAWAVRQGAERRAVLGATGIAAAVVLALFAPFLLWNVRAFLTDTVLFNFGGGVESYPIQGIGFSSILLQTGIIHGPRDAFPFLSIQLPLVMGVWLLSWRWFRRHRQAGDVILWTGIALLVFLFTNRFTQPAYVLLAVELILAGLLGRLASSRPATSSADSTDLTPAAA